MVNVEELDPRPFVNLMNGMGLEAASWMRRATGGCSSEAAILQPGSGASVVGGCAVRGGEGVHGGRVVLLAEPAGRGPDQPVFGPDTVHPEGPVEGGADPGLGDLAHGRAMVAATSSPNLSACGPMVMPRGV